MITIKTMVENLKSNDRWNLPDNFIRTFVSKMVNEDKVIAESEAFAFYVKVDDETLKKIHTDPGYIMNHDNLKEMLNGTGDNVHFFGLISTSTKGPVTHSIIKGLKDIIEKEHPKTISWWNRTMSRIITRRILCHQ